MEELVDRNDVSFITYKQWIANPKTTSETLVKSVNEFIPYRCEKVCELLPHAFIATQQSSFSRVTKDSLKDGEIQVTVDFAESR